MSLIAALGGIDINNEKKEGNGKGKKRFDVASTRLWTPPTTDTDTVGGQENVDRTNAKTTSESRNTKPWARLKPDEAQEMRQYIDPRVKTRLKRIERESHDTSPWKGNAVETKVFPLHKLCEVREKQSHDTSPWRRSERDPDDSEAPDNFSVCSSVSSIAPWDVERPKSRNSRKHYHKVYKRSTRLWEAESAVEDMRDVVVAMVDRGLSAEMIMMRLAQVFNSKTNICRRGRRRKSGHGRRDQWPDGTIKDTMKNGFALISRPSGQKEVLTPTGDIVVVERPARREGDEQEKKTSRTAAAGHESNCAGSPKNAPMSFDNVYSDRFAGRDTESSIVLGSGSGSGRPAGAAAKHPSPPPPAAASSMTFDNVYSDRHAGRDTESSIMLGSDRCDGRPGGAAKHPAAPSSMPFDNVYSDRFAGRDTESSIVLGSGSGRPAGAAAKHPSPPSPAAASSMPFDNVYSDRFAGRDTESSIVLGSDRGGGRPGGAAKDPPPLPVATSMPFDNVYSDRFAGRATQSSIVFGNRPAVSRATSSSSSPAAFMGFTSADAKKKKSAKEAKRKKASPAASLHRATRQLAFAKRNMHRTGQISSLG
eukprot:g408.t1